MNLTCKQCRPVPKLDLHYAPGMLWVLKRMPCPTDLDRFPRAYPHNRSSCCGGTHSKWQTTGAPTLLKGNEDKWCLSRCWIPERVPA